MISDEGLTEKLKSFVFEGQEQTVSYIESTHVTHGVDCDVYVFVLDTEKDEFTLMSFDGITY